jgi:natural product biosynthesis luciferase-like monooxygenase protein
VSNVEAHGLTAVQQGMLFHRLQSPESGVDIEQMVATLREPIDAARLRGAWQAVCDLHPVLRSRVRWQGLPSPVLEVVPVAALNWAETDLSHLPAEEQALTLDRFLRDDRERGVELDVAPAHRLHLYRLGALDFRLVWTFPHLLLDGGSFDIVVGDVFAEYDGDPGARRTAPRPYADHIAWLAQHVPARAADAERHFRRLLAGFSARNELCDLRLRDGVWAEEAPAGQAGNSGPRLYGEIERALTRAQSDRIRELAREHGLTAGTFVQAAWALVVSDFSREEEVVFGVVRASRRTALPEAEAMVGLFINTLPTRTRIAPERSLLEWLAELRADYVAARPFEHTPLLDIQATAELPKGTSLFDSVVVYNGSSMNSRMRSRGGAYEKREFQWLEQTNFPVTLFGYGEPELLLRLSFDPTKVSDARARSMLERTLSALAAMAETPERRLGELSRIPEAELATLRAWNATEVDFPRERCLHEWFEAQVTLTPDATAAVYRDQALSYRELDERANRVARRLRDLGVVPDAPVGIFLERSLSMLVGLLGIAKAGGAYLPLDPSYPRERIEVMLADSRTRLVLTDERHAAKLPPSAAQLVLLDARLQTQGDSSKPSSGVTAKNLAYVIFTSGSTGRPKGVMVEHRNVANFFVGMDRRIGEASGTWLAITSISFDISVLELFWTLARGFKVVIQEEADKAALVRRANSAAGPKGMAFSLFYFSADAGEPDQRYRLLLDGARFADRHGFLAVWTPERHFHAFGGLYPNPSVTSAALATITERVQLRAGSVVLPLHNPIRVAEEWSVVDNLSNGRVGLSFASGWHANDFALMPDNFAARRELTFRGVDLVRRLWRGESTKVKNGAGAEIEVTIHPRPVRADPPIWLTTAGNVETFRTAGELGVNVLTNMLGQSVEELREKLAAYRAARRERGHAGEGHVTLMLHTFVGTDVDVVRELVRKPFTAYLKTSTDLVKKARWEFPAFARPSGSGPAEVDDRPLTAQEEDALMAHAFERYFKTHGLFGTPQSCRALVESLQEIGVDEIACLIDFGVATQTVLQNLEHLNELKEAFRPEEAASQEYASLAAQLVRHQVTHLQCTPSLARLLVTDPEARQALGGLRKLMVGGEELTAALRDELTALLVHGELLNMYGPTETTVWSTTAQVAQGRPITIGRPIANTRIEILDRHLARSPLGVPGELCIGGEGVTRGYFERPELTAERFIEFREPGSGAPPARLYRTGDLARFRADGSLEFQGRLDHQVKVRGYRIELGEIETVLASHGAIREAVVVSRQDVPGDARLVAYVVPSGAATADGSRADGWRQLWDEAYQSAPERSSDARFDTSGWNSSYTGEPIPAAQMRDWLEHTVARIASLGGRRVLEIGCGTGLLLFRLATGAERYVAADFSAVALQAIERELARQPIPSVELRRARADELTIAAGAYDTVVLNSVVQYFPSLEYLQGVLDAAWAGLAPGGALFVGDVRNLELLEAFHASVVLEQARPSTSASELSALIARRVERDGELLLSAAFFRDFAVRHPDVSRVRIEPKRGRLASELQAFRFDVVLHKAGAEQRSSTELQPEEIVRVAARDLADVPALRQLLSSRPSAVHIAGLVNARTALELSLLERLAAATGGTASELREEALAARSGAWEPEDLYALDAEYEIELEVGLEPSRFDAWFLRRDSERRRVRPRPGAVSSERPRSRSPRNTGPKLSELEPLLREYLRQKLPDFMVPSNFVALDRLPLTPNGKVDRKALPSPDLAPRATHKAFVPASNDVERTIAAVWSELLRTEDVDVNDNLFDLGANSLLVMQANGRLRSALGKPISLVEMFQFPSVASLAAHLGESGEGGGSVAADAGADRAQARREAMLRRRVQASTIRSPKR